jgi:hypothetical protein
MYFVEESFVDTSKNGKSSKIFPALERPATQIILDERTNI